ncbi:MAG: insulinase family protein [Verrucomicrobiales bacterium]|nr:insulinase family protein [Verrucomicrobiales bacterium]
MLRGVSRHFTAPAHRVHSLANGVNLVFAPMPHMASVSVGFWMAVGGRHESVELNGVSHFIEHMLFKGTRRRSARQISEAVEGVGGYVNAFTSEEHTCYYARAPQKQFELLVDVLADMVRNPLFESSEIDKERSVIKEEIAMYLDQPHHYVQEVLNAALWPEHPLGRSLTGTPEGLDRLGRTELKGFHRTHYTGANLTISVAGNLSERRLLAALRPVAAGMPQGTARPYEAAPPVPRRPGVRLITRDTEQTQAALGVRTCARHDPRRYALRLLNAVLGENMSSRLFVSLREDRGLAYSVGSSISFFEDAGDLVVSLGLETRNLPEALRLITAEMRRLTERAPGRVEFQRALDYSLGQIDLGLESTESRMNWLGEQYLGHGRLVAPAVLKRRMAEVRPADVRQVAREFFRAGRASLALVSPLKRAGQLRPLLGGLPA